MTNQAQSRFHLSGSLRIEHLWMLIVPATICILANLRPIPPHDFWWHLKGGEIIVQTHIIPTVDSFSFTMAGKPYDNYAQFWLSESLMYLIFRVGGLQLLIFAHALAITLAYSLVLAACRLFAGVRTSVIALLFAAALGFLNWNLRPQGFVLPLAAGLLWCLVRDLQDPKRKPLVAVPLIMLMWANSHGSWVIGALLLGAYCVARLTDVIGRERSRRGIARAIAPPAVTAFLGLLAVLVNPRGVRILTYVVTMAGDPVSQELGIEWIPASFGDQLGAMFIVGFFLCSLLLMLSPRRPKVFELLTYTAFGLLAFKMIRAIMWFGLVMAPVSAAHLAYLFEKMRSEFSLPVRVASRPTRYALNVTILAFVLMSVAVSTPWFKQVLPLPPHYRTLISDGTPVAAVEFMLQNELGINVFNEQGFGSYLIWAASPPYRVYVDPRLELYTLELAAEYWMISRADDGWDDTLAIRGVDTLLLSPISQSELIGAAEQSSSWQRLYADDQAVVFGRRN